jgi:hypothetical protein
MQAVAGGAKAVRVAILKDSPSVFDFAPVEQALQGADFDVRAIDIAQLASRDSFNSSRYDCLVLSDTRRFTAEAKRNFFNFLKGGGDLVLLGAAGFTAADSLVLPAFSKYEPYVLKDVVSLQTSAGQDLLRPMELRGHFEGLSAIGFNRTVAKYVPLVTATDAHGRRKGWAAGLLIHYGEYKGSNWLLFGISNPEFYRTSFFADTLKSMLPKMRSGALEQAAAVENEKRLAAKIKLTTPAPAGFLRLSDDRRHIVYPDGRRFFMIGANYNRPLIAKLGGGGTDDLSLEDDFRKAHDAGINCLRIGFNHCFYDNPDLIKECARKYGIYLLIILEGGTKPGFVENAEKAGRMYGDEPMVLGYDIANEPKIDEIASLKFDGAKSPILALRPYERYQGKLDKSARRGIDSLQNHSDEARDLAAYLALWKQATAPVTQGSNATFPGLRGQFKVADEWNELYTATNETLRLWLGKHIEAIRKYDKVHLISVGYNRVLECLPANQPLNFVSHHAYEKPFSYEKVISNVTTLDRIAAVWPGRPITFGEFGYSNGIMMPDGKYLDFHTSALGEMIHYLYALAHGYDGAMKWTVTDWHWDPIAKAADKGRATQIYEAYFGLYWYDGGPRGLGRPKPICYATKFLRDYLDANGSAQHGTLEIKRASTRIGAAYVYKDKNALFVGDTTYQSPEIEFRSEQPANVMMTWSGNTIKILSTGDTTLSIAPARLVRGISAENAAVTGARGSTSRQNDRLTIELLEGEAVRIRAK